MHVLAAVLVGSLLIMGQAFGMSGEWVERPVEDELLLDLWLKKDLAISDDFIAYISPRGGMLVPLEAFCRIVGFAVTVDVGEGTAEGYVLEENERFYLDMDAGEVTVSGVGSAFPTELVERHQDDIYVESSLLNKWFPLQLQIDQLNSIARVFPKRPLPMQQRWERELRFRRLASQRSAIEGAEYPAVENGFRAWSGPFIDQSLDVRLTRDKEGGSTRYLRHATLMTMDLGYWNTRLFLSGDDQEVLADERVTFARTDPDGRLLGPFGARQLVFGDFNAEGITLLHSGHSGQGAMVSNFPVHNQGQFSSHDFYGDALPGWEVELYRNDVLLDYQQVGADGRYRFEAVPLLYGVNVFRVVTYGPQGQRRSEIQRFNIARPLVRPGEHLYRFTATQSDDGAERVSAEYRTGINDTLTADAGLSTWRVGSAKAAGLVETDEWSTQGVVGLHAYRSNWFGSLNLAFDADGEAAAQFDLLGRMGSVNLSYQHQELWDFVSERYTLRSPGVRRSDSVQLNGHFRPGKFFSNIGYSLSALREERNDDSVFTEFGNRVSVFHPRLSVSNELALSIDKRPTSKNTRADGNLRLRAPLNGWNSGGEITYQLEPESALKRVGLAVDRRLDNGYLVRVAANRHMAENKSDLALSLSRRFKYFTLTSTVGASDEGEVSAGLNFTTAAARSSSGDWSMSAKPLAESGGASVSAFLDSNRNGIRDADEEGLEGIGLRLNGSTPRATTGTDGNALLHGLPANRWSTVSLAGSDIDPAWLPARRGVRLVARPGTMPQIDFPLVVVGEIDGTVSLSRPDGQRSIGDVKLQLVDRHGAVVQQEETAYDGFYLFTAVLPGRYQVRVDPAQAARLGLAASPGHAVLMADDGPVISGMDFLLRKSGEPAPSDAARVAPSTPPAPQAPTWVVQVGSFSSLENAARLVARLREQGVATLAPQKAVVGDKTRYRVLVGPAASRAQAEAMLDSVHRVTGKGRLLIRSIEGPAS